MNKPRLTRFLFALALCGTIASLLPLGSGTVLADDGYTDPKLKLTTNNALRAALYTGMAQSGASGLAGHSASLFGLGNTPIYDVYRNHADQFSHIIKLIHNAELTNFYRESTSHTVLLPNDQVLLESLGKDALEALENPTNKARAAAFLRARTLDGSYSFGRLLTLAKEKGNVTTLDGHTLPLRHEGERLWIGNAEVIATEFPASNGFILVTSPLLTIEEEN